MHSKANDHDWLLTTHPEVENGVYFAQICPTGKEIGFPSLGTCQKGGEAVRKAGSCSEVKGWVACCVQEGRSRHGQVSAWLELLRRPLTLKESCQIRRASGQNRQATRSSGGLRNWLRSLQLPTS